MPRTIPRDLKPVLRQLARKYPVVTLTGPRQSGKTTLVQECFPKHAYANLEHPVIRRLAEEDPVGFFAKYPAPVVIDEIQRVPALTSFIQVAVDAQRHAPGQYVLTGSHQARLHETVTQSLAGRTALLNLMPLALHELPDAQAGSAVDDLLWRGFMPQLYRDNLDPTTYYANYFKTYVERDLRREIQIRNLAAFERFVTLLAGRTGQVVHLSGLAGETGVSSTTLAEWLSILEASFLVFRLRPYFSNVSKRVVKSPKIYFTEVGLAAYLLGIENPLQMSRDPARGRLFENLVVVDFLKTQLNLGKEPRLFYLREDKGLEIDLLVQQGRQVMPVEIKSAMTFHSDFVRSLRKYCDQDPAAVSPLLVYAGEELPEAHGVKCVNFRNAGRQAPGVAR